MIRLATPEIDEAEVAAVTEVLRSGYLVQGEQVRGFEASTAEYVGAQHAIAVTSGTAALHLALLALGIGPGDEVIVPDFTWPATANVVELVGAKPRFIDIDLNTFNLDAAQLEALITPQTKAILPVHLFGQPAEMGAVMALARQHNLHVIEDAACALGSTYQGQHCGSFGEIGCFSYHPRKIVTTGEGGMLVTDDDELAERLRSLRNHGLAATDAGPKFIMAGFNYRMTDMQGALGLAQMDKLDAIISKRRMLVNLYREALSGVDGIMIPQVIADGEHSWQSFVLLLDAHLKRDKIIETLRTDGIESNIGTYAVSAQPYYAAHHQLMPQSMTAYQQSLCLPLSSSLTPSDIETVADGLRRALATQ